MNSHNATKTCTTILDEDLFHSNEDLLFYLP